MLEWLKPPETGLGKEGIFYIASEGAWLKGHLNFRHLTSKIWENKPVALNVQFIVAWFAVGKEPACQCRKRKRHEFNPCVRKISWRRKWQPTPVLLSGEFHGQRSLVSCNLWDCKELDTTEYVHIHKPPRNEYISSLVAQMIKNPTAIQETWVRSLGQEDPLEKKMATHSSILAWRIPRTEEPCKL